MQNTIKLSNNSCVESSAAPEWLSKLEHRREYLMRGKLGHEVGAGAPCNFCGEKCPGLDLHYWRKVCRNCKCRKDQHSCMDEDLCGWAQFEILGQIRSKPAFIKIKTLADQPVRLDWVPPNATPDVVSDYMDKLGVTQIPIHGSSAAAKRKQQLEFQVPPHDLDATFCDDLTEIETNQLLEYVQKVRQNCVGQGSVVRVGRLEQGVGGHMTQTPNSKNTLMVEAEYMSDMVKFGKEAASDIILRDLLACEKLQKALISEPLVGDPTIFVAFSAPISRSSLQDWDILKDAKGDLISEEAKTILSGLNQKAVESLVRNGHIYDEILAIFQEKNLDITRDPTLGPIASFLKEHRLNPQFKDEVNKLLKKCKLGNLQFATPIKAKSNPSLNSPLPIKTPIQARFGTKMDQVTPMRKVKLTSPVGSTHFNSLLGYADVHPAICKFAITSGIEEMNMYPTVQPCYTTLTKPFQNLKLSEPCSTETARIMQATEPLKLKCFDCQHPINYGEVIVKAERAGKETEWHPECFKCHTCRELLADLVYFFYGGHIYCGRDLAIKLKIPRCRACDELIFTKEYTAAEGTTFHIKHFCCYYCDTPLAGQQYIPDERTNMPLCFKCYEEYFAAPCQRCCRPIGPADQGVAWGEIHWHELCFSCAGANCTKSLIGSRFCVKQNRPFCSSDCVRSVTK